MSKKFKQVAISDFDVIQIIENYEEYIFTPGFNRKFKTQGDVVECCILYCLENDIIKKIKEKKQ